MLIKAKTTITDQIALTLNGNDDLLVGRDVVLLSETLNAVVGSGNNQELTIAGILSAEFNNAIVLDAAAPGGRVLVTIAETGVILAGRSAILVRDQSATIVNHGLISASGPEAGGILLGGVSAVCRVVNSGTILVSGSINSAVAMTGDGRQIFVNSGTVISQGGSSFGAFENSVQVRNSGLMVGDVFLGIADSVYDGRGGRVVGNILGAEGNDRFVPGAAVDRINGGEGTNTIDFRPGGAVKVALDGAFANTGAAKGDIYLEIENILGSARGNDVLRGTDGANDILGNGGNDRLNGLGGEDGLSGGKGRDTLTGGTGDDFFVFTSPRNGADVITDFSSVAGNDDRIAIRAAGFGGGLTPDPVLLSVENRFHSGRTNQAQDRNDRFIFRTGDETLWFDADGKGGKGPVLIADFADGVRLTAEDFVLF